MNLHLQKPTADLANGPVVSLALSLAVPAIIAQIANAIYNISDRIFISHISGVGDEAITGIGVCFPITIAVSAFALLIGSGGAPLASIQLGKKNTEKAEEILGVCFASTIVCSVLLSILLEISKDPILKLFGASPDSLPFAERFLSIYLIGTLPVQFTLSLTNFISAQGKTRVAMCSTLVGTTLNFLFDPVFIFLFNWGVGGAAFANIISQTVSMCFVIWFLASSRSLIQLKASNIKINYLIIPILKLGVSPFVMQLTECLINIVFNMGLHNYGGDNYIAAMTIINSCMQLIYIFSNGITQGIQPIIGYNYGARNMLRVKTAFRVALFAHITMGCLFVITMILFPAFFARIFTSSKSIITVVERMLPIFVSGWGVFGVQSAVQCALMGLGQAKLSLFLACLRKIFLLIPLALILPHAFGVIGIFVSEPIADVTSAVIAGILFRRKWKQILGQITDSY